MALKLETVVCTQQEGENGSPASGEESHLMQDDTTFCLGGNENLQSGNVMFNKHSCTLFGSGEREREKLFLLVNL